MLFHLFFAVLSSLKLCFTLESFFLQNFEYYEHYSTIKSLNRKQKAVIKKLFLF